MRRYPVSPETGELQDLQTHRFADCATLDGGTGVDVKLHSG